MYIMNYIQSNLTKNLFHDITHKVSLFFLYFNEMKMTIYSHYNRRDLIVFSPEKKNCLKPFLSIIINYDLTIYIDR